MLDMNLARQILGSDGFFRSHAIEIIRLEKGDVELEVQLTGNVLRLGGIMSGAAIMAFADAAAAFCAMMSEDVLNEVTSSFSTSFFSPVKTGPARFRSTMRKEGRTLAYCHVEVRDGKGMLCAESAGTYYLLRD